MEKKIGVYICSGCGIGESLNVEKLARTAQNKGGKVVKTHACLCGEEGNALIANDVANEGVNTVVIAACSARAMTDAFRIDVPILERVNLREHVAWSHEPNDEHTQTLAEDYLDHGHRAGPEDLAARAEHPGDLEGHPRRRRRPDRGQRGAGRGRGRLRGRPGREVARSSAAGSPAP